MSQSNLFKSMHNRGALRYLIKLQFQFRIERNPPGKAIAMVLISKWSGFQ